MTTSTGSLALVGGAAFGDTHEHHRGPLAGASKVTLLPTAMAYEDPGSLIDEARSHFATLGIGMEVLPVYSRSDANDPGLVSGLADAEVLYVTGGSPMHLRSVLLESSLLELALQRWEDGMTAIAAGESASVLCNHMVDHRGGAFTVGLGLITTFTVIARFDRWSSDKRHRTVGLAPANLPVVGIDEATSLVRDPAGTWSTDGSGGVHVFHGGVPVDFSEIPAALN